MALMARRSSRSAAHGLSGAGSRRGCKECEDGVVSARVSAGGVEPRLALLDIGGKMGGPRAARRRGGAEPDLGLDQRAPQSVEPGCLRRPATVRLAAILVAVRHLVH